jgi:hypothetical protein
MKDWGPGLSMQHLGKSALKSGIFHPKTALILNGTAIKCFIPKLPSQPRFTTPPFDLLFQKSPEKSCPPARSMI